MHLGDAPAAFEWYAFECVGPDIMFTGAPVIGTVSKGPRKGHKRYGKDVRRVVVTDAECMVEYARYEAETGKCGDCRGAGKVVSGWHHVTGTSYSECSKCHGSGLLASAQSADAVAGTAE